MASAPGPFTEIEGVMASVIFELLAIIAAAVAVVGAYLWYLVPGPRDRLE